jgi:perosamine synthetase
MIPIYKPYLSKYSNSAINAIQEEWISNHGIYIDLAVNKLKSILNVKYCILMNNGTSATHCLFKSLKFKYPNINKIYIPNNVFISPINCALLEYKEDCLEIMKLDINTLNINTSEEYIKSLEKNSAMVIVHNLSSIVNVPRLKKLRPDIIFIEDNCEGLFGKYEGVYTGSTDSILCSAVSFYGNKTITTGEGGAFFTNDLEVYKYIKTFYSHGMSDTRYIHNILGTNYRMTNVQAAFLYDQLNDIEHILELKKNIFNNYYKLFKTLNNENKVIFLNTDINTEKSNWMFVVLIPNIKYTEIEQFLIEKQIQIRPIFYDLHNHKHLKNIKKYEDKIDNKNLNNIGIILPSYPELTYEKQIYILESIKEYLIINNI